ncbi:MAG: hypothetical protein NZM65_00460 [Flavobacteriales bacterium]|nr:hypothetical protein [Flavobacteriales bacterium]MDW8409139.1 hypothetical protein [Flavobacteriales bacterium]
MQFLNDDPGVIWHSVGVKRAASSSFSGCENFIPHFKVLQPDLMVLSLVVSVAHGPGFRSTRFRENYSQLVQWLRKAALLFITNNNTYLGYRYPNSRHMVARQVLLEFVVEVGEGVYDLYLLIDGT